MEENEIRNPTASVMEILNLPRVNMKICQPQEIEERCNLYLSVCAENGMKPSLGGLALALGTSRNMIVEYARGAKAIPDDNREVLLRFYDVLIALMEDYMLSGKTNPVGLIFLMKNNFGYKDQQDITFNNNVNQKPSEESLIEEANLLLEGKPKKATIDD